MKYKKLRINLLVEILKRRRKAIRCREYGFKIRLVMYLVHLFIIYYYI